MYWYLVIGVTEELTTETTYSRRWQAAYPGQAAEDFFYDRPEFRRCLVTLVDTSVADPQKTYVYEIEREPKIVPR